MGLLRYDSTFSLDDPNATLVHRELIKSKPFLRKLYEEWYAILNEKTSALKEGTIALEIGSGGGFLKEVYPRFVTSDIMPLDCCDQVFSAEDMPYGENELGAVVMLNVLHHIPRPRLFFSELQRTLVKGGKLVMIEPANSMFSRFIYRNFHHEPFEPKAKQWEIASTGPLSGANGANPWIIFERDKQQFETDFPGLKLIQLTYHTPLRYLLSGGVSMKALVPDGSFGFFKGVEKLIHPLSKQLGMFVTIEVEKI